jgi:uncharacterized protein with HEPN domain
MSKDDLIYLGHMLDSALRAMNKVDGVTRAEFDADDNLQLAVAHLIQTIGEAARRVSADFQQAHPEIPWRQITGMRHRIVHDYLHVDFDVVWDVATRDLKTLAGELAPLVPPASP